MEQIFSVDYIERIIIAIVFVASSIVALYYIVKLIKSNAVRLKDRSKRKALFRKAVIPILLFTIVVSLKVSLPAIISDTELLKSVSHLTLVLLIFAGTWIAINTVRISRVIILSNYDVTQKNNLLARKMHTQLQIIERILIFIIVFISLASILLTFESIRRIGVSLFASAGVAGLIIGLAAQKVIGSILAGFQLAITQPIRIDDVVIVENEWGWIEEITLTYVVIRLWDRRRLVVPTTYFIENPFQNWTRKSSDLIGSVFVFTDYTMPVEELRGEFLKILQQTDLWDGDIANVQVTNSTNQSLEIRFLMSSNDSPNLWDLRVFVREKIVAFLQQNHPDKLPKTRVDMQPPSQSETI
jgi:small-conductance mechanosensitive channel